MERLFSYHRTGNETSDSTLAYQCTVLFVLERGCAWESTHELKTYQNTVNTMLKKLL